MLWFQLIGCVLFAVIATPCGYSLIENEGRTSSAYFLFGFLSLILGASALVQAWDVFTEICRTLTEWR